MSNSEPLYKPIHFIGFLFCILFAYTWTTPLRDIYGLEIRNALIAREMLERGLTFIPEVLGQPYPDYPPLYFWLEVLFSLPFGHVTTFSIVLPGALSAVGLVAMTFRLGSEISPRMGWLAALLLATFPDFWLKAGTATIDMLLALNVTAAICCLYFREQSEKRSLYAVGIVIFLILAFLTKGPVGLVLPGIAWGGYLLLEKRFKDFIFFTLFMIGIGTLCIAVELIAVWKQGGSDFVRDVVKMQALGRVGKKANHPPYYYIGCLLSAGGIWWLWCIPSLKEGFRKIRENKSVSAIRKYMPAHPVNRLAMVWFLGILILFSLASTRHSRYILPLFPALAILIASGVDRVLAHGEMQRGKLWETILTGMVLIIAFAGLVFVIFFPEYRISSLHIILTAFWFAVVIVAWVFVKRIHSKEMRIVALSALMLVTGLSGTNLLVWPAISQKASGRAFVEASEAGAAPDMPVVIYKIYHDGDGLKYALYSSRNPSDIRFISQPDELRNIPRPCLLIAYQKDSEELQSEFGSELQLRIRGMIRSHWLVAFVLNPTSMSFPKSEAG